MYSSLVFIRGTGSRCLWSRLQALRPNHKSLKLITDVCHLLRFIYLFWLNKFKLLTLTLTDWLTMALRPLCVHNVNSVSFTKIINYKKKEEDSKIITLIFDFWFFDFIFGLRF